MDEFTSKHVHAEFADIPRRHRCSVQCIHFQTSWLHCVGRCGRICCRDSYGRAGETQRKGLLVFSGRTYSGDVRDDTKEILGREPLLLREWATIHASELLEIAGS